MKGNARIAYIALDWHLKDLWHAQTIVQNFTGLFYQQF